MPKPTLFLPGYLKENKDIGLSQEEADKIIPIDYIMNWFDQRVPRESGGTPSLTPKSSLDKILIVKSSTGSGKSTTIPPYFYQLFFKRIRKNIAITQPKILTAIEISKNTIPPFNTKEQLSKEGHPTWEPIVFGYNIGVQTGIFQKKPIKGMIYMTSGVLTQQLFNMDNESFMKKYSLLIIDEAHERSIELDLLLFMIKKFIKQNYQNKDCPLLLVMSATFNPRAFANYLLDDIPKSERYNNIINVSGFSYPIQEIFLKYDSQNLYESIVEKIKEIHKDNIQDFLPIKELNNKILKIDEELQDSNDVQKIIEDQKFRDILVFIRGPKDIKELKRKIDKLNTKDSFFEKYPMIPLGLTSELVENQSVEYRSVVERDINDLRVEVREKKHFSLIIRKPVRRVIFASNVAETGLTLNTLKYVIDPGFLISNEFFPSFGVKFLVSKPVTQSMHIQRKGRAGRKHPGICYSMFTEEVFNAMIEDQFPDIIKKEITLELLGVLIREVDPENKTNEVSLKQLFLNKNNNSTITNENELSEFEETINNTKIDITKLDLMDVPSSDSLHYSMEKLYVLGAINYNSIPTRLGFIINKFRFLSIENIKMILSGYAWNAPIQDLITIAAFINYSSDIFKHGEEGKFKSAEIMGKFTLFQSQQNNVLYYSKYKTDLMLSDNFIRTILIFYELQQKISEINVKNLELEVENEKEGGSYNVIYGGATKLKLYKEKNIIEILENWGSAYGINIKIVLDILELRDTIINLMAIIGLNPYHNFNESFGMIHKKYNDLEMMNYISKIKHCIYEGYKLNLAVYNPIDKTYYIRKSHLPLEIESDYLITKIESYHFGDTNPKYIIYDEILFLLKKDSDIYSAKVRNISILDGYITIDPNFLNS